MRQSCRSNLKCVQEQLVTVWAQVFRTREKPRILLEKSLVDRTQRTRTVAQLPSEGALLEVTVAPLSQRIARKAFHLQQLGISQSAISRQLGVADKTRAKAIAWFMAHRAWEDASLSIRPVLHETGVTQ